MLRFMRVQSSVNDEVRHFQHLTITFKSSIAGSMGLGLAALRFCLDWVSAIWIPEVVRFYQTGFYLRNTYCKAYIVDGITRTSTWPRFADSITRACAWPQFADGHEIAPSLLTRLPHLSSRDCPLSRHEISPFLFECILVLPFASALSFWLVFIFLTILRHLLRICLHHHCICESAIC